MPTTTLECYTAGTYNHSIQFKVDSQYHDPQGSVYGPPGSVSREVDPIGLEGLGLKGLLGLLVVGRDVKKKIQKLTLVLLKGSTRNLRNFLGVITTQEILNYSRRFK